MSRMMDEEFADAETIMLGSGRHLSRWYRVVLAEAKRARAAESAQAERIRVLEEALRTIEEWDYDLLPRVPDKYHEGETISYSWAYGSNGVRDYFRAIARAALKEQP